MRVCLCVCTCLCLCDWLGANACVSADCAKEPYTVVSKTVATSQFTLPLAMLNLKVRAVGGLAVCLKTSSCPLLDSS